MKVKITKKGMRNWFKYDTPEVRKKIASMEFKVIGTWKEENGIIIYLPRTTGTHSWSIEPTHCREIGIHKRWLGRSAWYLTENEYKIVK